MTRKRKNHNKSASSVWAGPDSAVVKRVIEQSERCLASYSANPLLVDEHANIELATAQGGYGRRQIYELVQNGADALIRGNGGKIEVLLTAGALYCANEGQPIDVRGAECLLSSHVSMKRGAEIGRFGLGFKSVLGVSNEPEFYSRSGSFRFDREDSQGRILAVVPSAERLPALRIGVPADPHKAALSDDSLAELMEWATTVVKLPRLDKQTDRLGEDLANFPAEFLLFSPHVKQLALVDALQRHSRSISVRHRGKRLVLTEGQAASEWLIFEKTHAPSAPARDDAGELARRDQIPIIWAVPTSGRQHKVGTFWAFFPTVDQTTLSGIVNAPWKTNEDRQNLLPGAFNEELLDVLAELVVASIWRLTEEADPARYLDVLPGRGREARCWADEYLTSRVYEVAKTRESLPDQLGRMRRPGELKLHPEGVTSEALAAWAAYEGRPTDWCHPSVETRERRPRVNRLKEDECAGYREWLEALSNSDGTAAASLSAMRTAAIILAQCTPAERAEVLKSRIVLTSDGELVAPDATRVFLASWDYECAGDLQILDREIQASPDAQDCIDLFGFQLLDRTGEVLALLDAARGGRDVDWERFWALARALDAEAAARVVGAVGKEARSVVRVRTAAGCFQSIGQVLWPGAIVPTADGADDHLTVDVEYHSEEQVLLHSLGVASAPVPGGGSIHEGSYRRYLDDCRQDYRARVTSRSKPEVDLLEFPRPPAFAGPLDPLFLLSPVASERYCAALIACGPSTGEWRMSHRTRGEVYPEMQMKSPVVWALLERGQLSTSLGVALSPPKCVAPSLHHARSVLPVANLPQELAEELGLATCLKDVDGEIWEAALERALEAIDDSTIGLTYALASQYREPRDVLRCRVGQNHEVRPRDQIVVLADSSQLEALVAQSIPAILVPCDSDVERLVTGWGLRRPAEVIQTQLDYILTTAPTPIVDDYPALWAVLPDTAFKVARCGELRVETVTPAGKSSKPVAHVRQGDTLYVTDTIGEDDLLSLVARENGLPDDRAWVAEVLGAKRDEKRAQRARAIAGQPDLRSRVLATLGREHLLRHLPQGLLEAAEAERGELADQEIAELALAVYSVGLLRQYKFELEEIGLRPPSTWAGSRAARAFVRELGYPIEFAGAPQLRADALLRVFGPPVLPPLHEFQDAIKDKTVAMLSASPASRGMLSLPTGAGKTRVAVESVVTWYRDSGFTGPVVWIAHSEELCEQAVQTFSYIWRALGPSEELFISRLWSGNEAEPIEGAPQFVVATIQKLQNCVDSPDYDWLAQCACVIVDEAHKATETSYTRVLSWLGIGRSKARDRCPLVGLTATPFRGRTTDETKRLVSKFGERLDRGVLPEDPYPQLQELKVIARARHELLKGADVNLDHAEIDMIERMNRLPDSVAERIGSNVSRNRTLLESVRRLPEDWPVLMFATSVSHAQTMAALLQLEGVSAVAIHGGTDTSVRRHCIREFREGKLRVLTNYGVFTEGFDAPGVRAVYIARPTFSPGLYQQMIGRGLRGPANGGKEECLIVNVEDNFSKFGDALAFREFEYLWDEAS